MSVISLKTGFNFRMPIGDSLLWRTHKSHVYILHIGGGSAVIMGADPCYNTCPKEGPIYLMRVSIWPISRAGSWGNLAGSWSEATPILMLFS